MCMVCVEWEKGKMTALEVDRAFLEILNTSTSDEELAHAAEVLEKVSQDA